MATTIVFSDGVSTTLTNGRPSPGDRFANWTPDPDPIGDGQPRQSDGAITFFRLRDDYGARFDVPGLSTKRTAGVSPVDIAARLIRHLVTGGTCTVNTGDVASTSYATCGLKPGTKPTIALTDKRALEYTLSLHLINLAGSPVAMSCYYGEQ